MFTDTHQTGMLEVPRRTRSVRFGQMAGWLIVGLAVASLLVGMIWSNTSVRYPGAKHQAAASLSQQSAYQTSDDLPRVLRWYVQHFGLNHDIPQDDNCVTMTQVNQPLFLFLEQSITVTLCAYPRRTLILVNRSLAVR